VKLAFIVQRYGKDILGGSEALARQLAERLSRRHEVTVLTTTAKDYITWKNEYEPGEEKGRGVRIIRFPVARERNLEEFNKFSEEIYKGQTTKEQELDWLERQGPVVPELIDYLRKEQDRFDLLIFFTYLYYPTYYGLQVAPEKSVLVPTAHDEPPLRLGIYREMFQLPSSFVFNTEAEEVLVLERFPVHKKMRETIGMGMELLDLPDLHSFKKKHDIPGRYLLYAGRIDAGKGLEELFRFFDFYKEEHPGSGNLQLILIGRLGMKLPENSSIRYIGFVDEGDKLSAMAGAVAVVQPSRMESLSIVTLEALSVGTPVVVSAASRVLVDHCRRANAGLYYGDFEEFEEVLSLLLNDRNLGRSLGRNGQTYIKDNYGWNKVLGKYELVFRSSARPAKEPRGSRSRPLPTPEAESRSREPMEPLETDEMENPDEYVSTDELPLLEPEGALAEAEERAYRERDREEREGAGLDANEGDIERDSVIEGEASDREVEVEVGVEAERDPSQVSEPEREREREREDDLDREQTGAFGETDEWDGRDEPEDESEDEGGDDADGYRDAIEPAEDREEPESDERDERDERDEPDGEDEAESPEPEPQDRAPVEPAREEPVEVPEEVAHLPSFYRSASRRKPAPRPPEKRVDKPKPPPIDPADPMEGEGKNKSSEEGDKTESTGGSPREGGLPEFYRPRPKATENDAEG
jgi:glycosyltransferase involved in cell wall biosynthesis